MAVSEQQLYLQKNDTVLKRCCLFDLFFQILRFHEIFIISLFLFPDNMQLGKYAGLCKLDAEGNERKVVRCSSVVVRDWGKEEAAHDFLKEHIKQQRA